MCFVLYGSESRKLQGLDGRNLVVFRNRGNLLVQDPVTNKPAVLVFVHNITQQKQMEMQLAQRQEALQR